MRVTCLSVQILRKSRQLSYKYSPSNYASHVKSASETRQSRVPPEKLRFVRDYRGWGACASNDHVIVDDADALNCCPIGGGPTTP